MNKIEFGRVGHFLDGLKCRFFRHTHINNLYCISTIGDYWPHKDKQEPIGVWFGDKNLGYWRYYETRVFNLLDEYNRWVDIDGKDYITEDDALNGHEEMVKKYEEIQKNTINIQNQNSPNNQCSCMGCKRRRFLAMQQDSSSAPDDQLNGWTPVWQKKPDNDRGVKLLLLSDGIVSEYKGRFLYDLWTDYYKIVSLEFEDIIKINGEVLAWKEL